MQLAEHTLPVVALACALGALVFATLAYERSGGAEREADFSRRHSEELRIRVENAENTLIIAGLKKPRDDENWPENNPDRLKRRH